MKILMIDALGVLGLAFYDLRLCENLAAINSSDIILEVPRGYSYFSSRFIIRRNSRHMEKELWKLSRTWEYVKWLKGVVARAREWQPEIIHWQFGFFSLFDFLTTCRVKAALPQSRVVITIHDLRPGKPTFNQLFARKHFFRTADGVVVHSENARNDYLEWIRIAPKPMQLRTILYGPFDAPHLQDLSPEQVRSHFHLNHGGPVIIAIGSINENKDLAAGIKLVAELQKLCPTVNFFIGGSSGGQNLSALQEWKKQVSFPERIVILDRHLTDEEVDQVHRIAEFSLLIYKVSATSGAAIRSLCAGVPVICNDRPGFRAVVKDGLNGFMVKENDPVGEAHRIYQVLQNTVALKSMKEAAANSYRGVTWEQVAREHYSFYQELLGSHA